MVVSVLLLLSEMPSITGNGLKYAAVSLERRDFLHSAAATAAKLLSMASPPPPSAAAAAAACAVTAPWPLLVPAAVQRCTTAGLPDTCRYPMLCLRGLWLWW
jgi:hypothetical protein